MNAPFVCSRNVNALNAEVKIWEIEKKVYIFIEMKTHW